MTGLNAIKGQALLKSRLYRAIKASRARKTVLPHILLSGLGGTGKTTIAGATASEMQGHFMIIEGAELDSRPKIIELLQQADSEAKSLNKPLYLFIDECHRLGKKLQEVFYYAMKDWYIRTTSGTIYLAPFCLIAATTRMDMLDQGSFVTRFPLKFDIGRYDEATVMEILMELFSSEGIGFSYHEIESIARRCLGIPRIAHNLFETVRDEVYARGGSKQVTMADIHAVFRSEGLDDLGLGPVHRGYLKVLSDAHGKPRSVSLIAAKLSQNINVIEETVEPILLALGLADRGQQGRTITPAGEAHLISYSGF